MTRPQIVRADTLDLQDVDSPSASDHSRQPTHGSPLGTGPAAPSQQAALRHYSDELTTEEKRLSQQWLEAGILNQELDSEDERAHERGNRRVDELAISQNGGFSGDDDMDEDADSDTDLDDDMMDKVSSSPSIEDGGYTSSRSLWPPRQSSLTPVSKPLSATPEPSLEESPCDSSSPYVDTPEHFPLCLSSSRLDSSSTAASDFSSPLTSFSSPSSPLDPQFDPAEDHHRLGEYIWTIPDPDTFSDDEDDYADERRDILMPLPSEMEPPPGTFDDAQHGYGSIESEPDYDDISSVLLPIDDPILDEECEAEPLITAQRESLGTFRRPVSLTNSDASWETDSYASSDLEDRLQNDDDLKATFLSADDPRVDSGCGDDCLLDPEDIDFEFVYALHTFVATVEGQANAQKGDTMVLLDDSNSYWWLVRIVKDSSIGYLPAEHIETPTERLARLNKHRNIDLSATMLGDNAEKSKNPLKKAMRRRNAKAVHFSEPTYVEASDYDYSSDEENEADFFGSAEVKDDATREAQAADQDEITAVEPLQINGKKESKPAGESAADPASRSDEGDKEPEEGAQPTDESLDLQYNNVSKSRNGTVRTTDSFFKDENTETRKITLTPKMLRDDSSSSTVPSVESRERGPSIDSLEKPPVTEKVKEEKEKKKKEKKQGMLSGLFKRKDKKGRQEGDSVDPDKLSEELSRRSPQPKSSEDMSSLDRLAHSDSSGSLHMPQRQPSKGKLQKARPEDHSPMRRVGSDTNPAETSLQPAPAATLRQVEPESDSSMVEKPAAIRTRTPDSQPQQASVGQAKQQPERTRSNSRTLNPINIWRGSESQPQQQAQPRREKAKKAKNRVALDDFDSPPEDESPARGTSASNPFADPDTGRASQQKQRGPTPTRADAAVARERLSESPIQISAADATEKPADQQQPPGLVGDSSSQETTDTDGAASPASPSSPILPTSQLSAEPPSSPTINTSAFPIAPTHPARSASTSADEDDDDDTPRDTPAPPHASRHSPLSQHSSPKPPPQEQHPWSPASLRSYLDDGSDIRDMLLLVRDVRGVAPVGRDHPIMDGLFVREKGRCEELGRVLDDMLGELVGRRKVGGGGGVAAAVPAAKGAVAGGGVVPTVAGSGGGASRKGEKSVR